MAKTVKGGCLCGNIRFEVTGELRRPHTCSCHMCQRHTGGIVTDWVEVSKDALRWTGPGGAPSLWRSSDFSQRAFCPVCGSSLGALDDAPTIGLLSGAFDRPNLRDLAPVTHSYPGSRPSWWKHPKDCLA